MRVVKEEPRGSKRGGQVGGKNNEREKEEKGETP